jgi:hypothetical protein
MLLYPLEPLVYMLSRQHERTDGQYKQKDGNPEREPKRKAED